MARVKTGRVERSATSTIGFQEWRRRKTAEVAAGARRAPRIQGRPDTDGALLPTADERHQLEREFGIRGGR